MRRRIWSETLPHDALLEPRVVELLRRHGVAPIVAVWPRTRRETIIRILDRFEDAGVPAALWPMLGDDEGRWASAGNAGVFVDFVLGLVDDLARERPRPLGEIAIDLEPAIERVRPLVSRGKARAFDPASVTNAHYAHIDAPRGEFEVATARLSALCARLAEARVRAFAAVIPVALFDPPSAREPGPFQRLMGTPVDGLPWDGISVMLYTSIIEGWSRGLLGRDDVRALLAEAARASAARYGARASASLGAVGTGAFGDEPVYRSAAELADDVAITRAAGIDDLVLFDLGGVMRRGDPEAWLEAFTRTEPAEAKPALTLRARLTLAGASLFGGALGALLPARGSKLR